MQRTAVDTNAFLGEMVHSLTGTCARPLNAHQWHCIVVWSLVGWRTACGDGLAEDDALLDMLREAIDALEGRAD